ncbi:hypothetical protein [Myceligenerans pegani]|uniref:DUF1772 domain-containing protein n=1 Tax=Myceligenerans pegani TaxID=2776917 RepID=A0ABR9MYY7_9MICO|nr:hypothetical protein [Myceligenerans sp. TRM 65318]MBE1876587.1 hypothetical protein [Myceligenerans sp. TRM 65318]MBE3018858.1 hypothetical protein [Myceligenerans sp. TRM 65318]
MQYTTAVTFLVIGLAAYRHGTMAQRAAEAEVTRQGLPPEVLMRHGVRVEESRTELMLPLGIAALLAVLATVNLTAPDVGRTSTWIVQPTLLLAGGFITASQVFTARFVAAAFRRSEDPKARAIDAKAVIGAASRAFPWWMRPLIVIRFALVTIGSAAVLLLLAIS